MLLKPVIGLAMIVAYYFGIIVPLRWAKRRLPPSKWKDALFRERGSSGGGPGTKLE